MARRGLNCTFYYIDDKKVTHSYQVRAGDIAHGVQMVAAEDQGRVIRAYYPHRSARQRFAVQVLLRNWDERTDLVSWMASYAQWALDPNVVRASFPLMVVTVPSRNFVEHGVPLTGYEWGAHTGQMMFAPQFVFEAGYSPHQPLAVPVSTVINKWSAFASDPAIQYFYPFGTQLQGTQVPQNYGNVTDPSPAPPPVVTPPPPPPLKPGPQ
jgi:hypothetical protein